MEVLLYGLFGMQENMVLKNLLVNKFIIRLRKIIKTIVFMIKNKISTWRFSLCFLIKIQLLYLHIYKRHLSLDQLKEFLQEIKINKRLYEKVSKVGTADDIASIAQSLGYEFTGIELKSIKNKDLEGIKIKKQDTSPSYPFGESGN